VVSDGVDAGTGFGFGGAAAGFPSSLLITVLNDSYFFSVPMRSLILSRAFQLSSDMVMTLLGMYVVWLWDCIKVTVKK
jgi:hypothetical protein